MTAPSHGRHSHPLRHHADAAPEEIHLVAQHGSVQFRPRQPCPAHDPQQLLLRLGTGEGRPSLQRQDLPEHRRSPVPRMSLHHLPQLIQRDQASPYRVCNQLLKLPAAHLLAEVEQRARRSGDRNALDGRHLVG
jgi:hypothetical protein